MKIKIIITTYISLFLISVFFCPRRTKSTCLSFDDQAGFCLVCSSGYFSNNFEKNVAIPTAFPVNECQAQIDKPLKSIEYVIREETCPEACNGSLEAPFDNFQKALRAAQSFSLSSTSTNISIYFMRTNFEGKGEFFWDSDEEGTVSHFFRRVNVNITISPLFCRYKNIFGCFNEEDPKPILYVRTEKNILFVTNILIIDRVILDGSEVAFDILDPIKKKAFSNKRFCNNSMLENMFNENLNSSDETRVCYLFKKRVSPNPNSNSLINIEPIFDIANYFSQDVSLKIINSEFKNFYSFSPETAAISSIFGVQQLKFARSICA